MKISIKAARVNANLTQKEIAEILGVSKHTIHNWETGKYKVDKRTLLALSKVYGIEEEFLF